MEYIEPINKDNKCAYIGQGQVGYIVSDSPVKKMATFGCGPCIAVAFWIKGIIALLAHVASPGEAKFLNLMLYQIQNALNSSDNDDDNDDGNSEQKLKLNVYLIGGYKDESENTRNTILGLRFAESGFEPLITDKSCESAFGAKSLLISLDGNISNYEPKGHEVINPFAAINSTLSGKLEIVSNKYMCCAQIIDLDAPSAITFQWNLQFENKPFGDELLLNSLDLIINTPPARLLLMDLTQRNQKPISSASKIKFNELDRKNGKKCKYNKSHVPKHQKFYSSKKKFYSSK
jgi:hypothetical protein